MYMILLNTKGEQHRNESKHFFNTHQRADLNNALHYSSNQDKLILDRDASFQPVMSFYKTGSCWCSIDCIWFNAISKNKLSEGRRRLLPCKTRSLHTESQT